MSRKDCTGLDSPCGLCLACTRRGLREREEEDEQENAEIAQALAEPAPEPEKPTVRVAQVSVILRYSPNGHYWGCEVFINGASVLRSDADMHESAGVALDAALMFAGQRAISA